MELTVLGRSGGVGRAGEACSGYLVSEGGTNVLLDCGSGVAANLQKVCPLGAVDHVVVSHWHPDHCSDAGILVHGRIIERLVGAVPAEQTLMFYGPDFPVDLGRLSGHDCSEARAVAPGDVLAVGPLTLEFCATEHPVPCNAVRVTDGEGGVLVYTADGRLTPDLAEFCRGADLVVAECSLYPGVDGSGPGHMNAGDVARLARLSGCRRVVLTHLPFYGDRGELLSHVRDAWDGPSDLAEELAVFRVGER